jgi:hypothetical protein
MLGMVGSSFGNAKSGIPPFFFTEEDFDLKCGIGWLRRDGRVGEAFERRPLSDLRHQSQVHRGP